jgi:hypothetical protein
MIGLLVGSLFLKQELIVRLAVWVFVYEELGDECLQRTYGEMRFRSQLR